MSKIELMIYGYDEPLGGVFSELPGKRFEKHLKEAIELPDDRDYLVHKLEASCRKLCLMWKAGDEAISMEREFYLTTIPDAPALFGKEAVDVHYHLEAMILFARASLDIACGLFAPFLPEPFPKRRIDSFNKMIKTMIRTLPDLEISSDFNVFREDSASWFSVLCGTEKGRSLRDKIVHQTEFPIEYMELNPSSEKEYAVVRIENFNYIPLVDFIDQIRHNVVFNYLNFEDFCMSSLLTTSSKTG